MKTFSLLLAGLALSFSLQAQTNAPIVPAPNAVTAQALPGSTNAPASTNRIEIFSDSAEFLIETNIAIYTGNVRAIYGETKMNCDVLTIHLPKEGERPDYMMAAGNVIILAQDKNGKPMQATGDQAVYTYSRTDGETNEVMVLSGNARIVRSQTDSMEGDPITWNLTKGTVHVRNQHTSGVVNSSDRPGIIGLKPKEPATNKPPANVIQTNTP
ncbi:MAG: hypothetical protein H7Y43_12840 [Akkermansiaceae bacterium]|nr:hypothetical protein [Verrucomicrobiales bacterium]